MSSGRRLRTAVILPDADGVFAHFGVGEAPPAWAAEALRGEDVWGEQDPKPEKAPEKPEESDPAPSPQPGPEDAGEPEEDASEDLIGAVERPANGASLREWKKFARSHGATDADLEGKSRNEIRATYGD